MRVYAALCGLLLAATPFWVTAGGLDSSGQQHPLLVNDAGQVTLACDGGVCTIALAPGDAGSFWQTLGGIDAIGNAYPLTGPVVSGKLSYLIPESGTVLTHVNAVDLNGGTAKVGGAWSVAGTVPYNSGTSPRPSVGPFSDSNYFYQSSSSPANVSSGPWTAVMLVNASSITNNPVFFSTGSGVTGVYAQIEAGTLDIAYGGGPVYTSNTVSTGTFAVLMWGLDSSGNAYVQLNNGSTASGSGRAVSVSSTNTNIGNYVGGTSFGFSGNVFELMVSTAVPSGLAFTNIYNSILANE